MKVMLVLVLSLLTISHANAQEPQQPKPIRVLLTYGIHPFPEKEFFAMWDALPGIQYTKAKMPEQMDLLKPGLEKQYDVLVRYDQMLTSTPEQRQAFVDLLKAGIGFVSLHHNLCAHDDWDEYRHITGALYLRTPRTVDGKEYGLSTFAENVDFNVTIADKEHEITRGLKDFTLHDEIYGNYYQSPDIHVLMTTDHPDSNKAIAWVTAYGGSPVFCFEPGHGEMAFADSNFQQILVRGIQWAAREREVMNKQSTDVSGKQEKRNNEDTDLSL